MRRLSREGLLEVLEKDPRLFAKLLVALAQVVAQRFRSAVEELEPVRAFASSLREPLDMAEARFDEIDEPLPEADPAAPPSPEAAVEVLKRVARKSRKKGSAAGV